MAPKRQYTMKEVFEECQQGLHTHNKLMTALQKNYKQTEDKAAFNDEFVGYLKYSMVIFKRESAVERTLDFVAKFAASFAVNEEEGKENQPDADNTFLTFLFDFLLKSHNGRDRAVRFRACQMINKLLTSLGEEAQIDDDLYDRIYRCMLARVQDKFPAVRVQAVMALARLQDPEDPDCPVIKAYLYLMEKDVNFEVRRTVLSCIAPASQTLPAILERTRDVKDTVRKMAYQVLAEKVHIRALTISQRIKVLQTGLTDHLDMVKDICTGKMLQSWLRTFDGNAIDLLKRMDVENSCTTAELALKAIFEKVPASGLVEDFDLLNEDLVIPIEELSCENVLYWCCLVEHVRSKGDEALMDKLMPTASAFCDYVHKNCDKLEISCHNVTAVEHTLSKEFVSEHLLKMTGSLDQSDEVGRKKLDSLVQDLLIAPHVPPSLVAILITRLKDFHSEDEERIELMAQIISDIRVPITTVEKPIAPEAIRQRELKLASIRMDLTQARDALEDTVANQDFTKAAEMKRRVEELECTKNSLLEESLVMNTTQEIRTEKSDPETLLKCLTIAAELMQHLAMKELNPTLQTLFTVLVNMVKDICTGKMLQSWLRTFDGNAIDLLKRMDVENSKKLDSLVQDLLIAPHVPPSLVAILITRLKDFHSEDEERIELMAQIISDIRVPITTVEKPIAPEAIRQRELKLASIRMDLTQARDALEDTVANQDFTKAAEMKRRVEELECTKNSLLEESLVMNTTQEIRTEKSDPETLLKCLTIAAELMQHLAMKELNPTLQTLFTVLVLPGITNEDPSVRNMAVKCLGLGAQISRVFAMQQLLLLMQISQVDQETVQVTALQAIFDTAQTYGLDIFKLPETSSEKPGEDGEKEGEKEKEEDEEEEAKDKEQSAQSAANSALSILTKLLDSESNELRTVSAEGLAKLLLSGRITSPKLLSRLLLLWYNPTSEEDQHLRSCLGAFFPVYSFAGRVHQECWEEAFLPTLRTLFNAPTTSPMAKVNPGNVAEFMVHLTDHTMLNNKQTADIQFENVRLSLEASENKLKKVEDEKKNVLNKLELVSKKFLDTRIEFEKASKTAKRTKTEMDDRLHHALTEGSKVLLVLGSQ
eukprot:XP_011682965.1 PREDICTED: condensin complex subunit 3-like [Strongylocentrotus purpuratus]